MSLNTFYIHMGLYLLETYEIMFRYHQLMGHIEREFLSVLIIELTHRDRLFYGLGIMRLWRKCIIDANHRTTCVQCQ